MAERLLEVKDLKVQFATEDGIVEAVDGVSFNLDRGKVLGIVGESGSGKSVTAMSLMGLTRGVNARFEGEVLYKGTDLLHVSDRDMQNFRGNELGMIFQDPITSLNPVYRIGEQIVEAIQAQDLPALMGVTLYGAAFIVVFSVLVDIFYAYLDPRIRLT